MRTFDPTLSQAMQSEEARAKLQPFLSEPFDPVVLGRPTFLDEIGLRPEDGPLLRAGGHGFRWLQTRLFERALAEEIRAQKATVTRFLHDYPGEPEEKQWKDAQKVFLRLEQLVLHKDRDKIASEVGLPGAQLDELRKAWKAEVAEHDQDWATAIQLQLLGVGRPHKQLIPAVQAQTTRPFLFFFRLSRPMLTQVNDAEVEVVVPHQAGDETVRIRQSMAAEIQENSKFGADMWCKQWVDYFQKHPGISNEEFRAFLHHLIENDRYQWPYLMAGQGAKARRGVAAAVNGLFQQLQSADDQASIQKTLDLFPQFSEKHELESILKKRFGV